jgi:hypothetical protein
MPDRKERPFLRESELEASRSTLRRERRYMLHNPCFLVVCFFYKEAVVLNHWRRRSAVSRLGTDSGGNGHERSSKN